MTPDQQPPAAPRNPLFNRIGRRVVLIMVLLSGSITLLETLIQLYWQYRQEVASVTTRMQEIEAIHAPLIADSLLNGNLLGVEQKIKSLVNLPEIEYLALHSDQFTFTQGKVVLESPIPRKIPLRHRSHGELGTLYVQSDAQQIYDRLLGQLLVILSVNGLKTLVVCAGLLLVFQLSVNSRLQRIADYLAAYSPRQPHRTLTLQRHPWIMDADDELQGLAEQTNQLTGKVTALYHEVAFEQQRFTQFAEISSDWLWETDQDHQLVFTSEPRINSLFAASENHVAWAYPPSAAVSQNLLRKLQQKQSFSLFEQRIWLDGQYRYFLLQGLARFESRANSGDQTRYQTEHQEETQRFVGFRGTALEITELKQTQLKLEQLNQNLEQRVVERGLALEKAQKRLIEAEKMAALGDLVAGVAHEVNTPLGIAVTANSLLKETTSELKQAYQQQQLTGHVLLQQLDRLEQSTELLGTNLSRAAQLIKDFKQTTVDQINESRSEFKVVELLLAVCGSLQPETGKIPVEPRITGDPTLVLDSYPGVFSQVLTNLLINSVRHGFDGTQTTRAPKITIDVQRQDHNLLLIYQDNGCGVPEAALDKIFEPFYTTKRAQGGSGLGLSLVYNQVTQKLGGKLTFSSKVGNGVKFELLLPLSPAISSKPLMDRETADE